MLDIAPNPYSEPIKKFIHDLKATKWKFPFILQLAHAFITIFLLFILFILYITIGIISQISNSFWDLITDLGQKMSYSNPIESSFYALSATIYFVLFLPFFFIQSPIWFSGWLSSKIGFRPFIVLIITILMSTSIYFFQPQLATNTLNKIIELQDSIRNEYFASDSLDTIDTKVINKSNVDSNQ